MRPQLSDDAVARGRRAQWAVVAVFLVHGVLFASWAAHIPLIKHHLRIDDPTLGLALLGTPIGSVTAIAVAGFVIPRYGSRLLVQVTLVGYCLSGPLVGLTGSVWGLLLALFLWGAFQGGLDIAMNTQAIAVEHQVRRPIMNGMHACWSLGAFAGAGIGTLGVALGVSLSDQLLIVGLPVMLAAGLLTTRMLLDSVDRGQQAADDGAERQRRADAGLEPAPRQRRLSVAMLALGLIAFASMLCEGAAADWSSIYVRDVLDGGGVAAGLAFTAFAAAMLVVRTLGNRLLTRNPAHHVLPVLALAAALGFGVALLVGTVAAALVGFFLLGLGLGTVVPSVFSAAGRLPDLHPGVGVAGVSGLGWAGFVFGPALIGQLAGLTSLRVALALVPLLTALIALATWRVASLREPSMIDEVRVGA